MSYGYEQTVFEATIYVKLFSIHLDLKTIFFYLLSMYDKVKLINK